MYNRVYYSVSNQYKRLKLGVKYPRVKSCSKKIAYRSYCSMGDIPPEDPSNIIILASVIIGMFYTFYR
jgi:hypothetical protein